MADENKTSGTIALIREALRELFPWVIAVIFLIQSLMKGDDVRDVPVPQQVYMVPAQPMMEQPPMMQDQPKE